MKQLFFIILCAATYIQAAEYISEVSHVAAQRDCNTCSKRGCGGCKKR